MKTRITAVLVAITLGSVSCESDNFYSVTKRVTAPDRIKINEPFRFEIGLINNTNKPIKLTLDKDVLKSLYFDPCWYCGKDFLVDRTPNPKEQHHDYYEIRLQPKDSISFRLTAQLISFSNNDSLKFIVDGYEKDFRLANPKCSDFNMRLGGMWIPGNTDFLDSMEGYDFRKKDIEIE